MILGNWIINWIVSQGRVIYEFFCNFYEFCECRNADPEYRFRQIGMGVPLSSWAQITEHKGCSVAFQTKVMAHGPEFVLERFQVLFGCASSGGYAFAVRVRSEKLSFQLLDSDLHALVYLLDGLIMARNPAVPGSGPDTGAHGSAAWSYLITQPQLLPAGFVHIE